MIFWWVCSRVTVQTTSNYSFSSVTFSLIYTVSIFLFIKMAERMSDCVNNGDTPSFLAKRQPQNHKKWTIKWVINLSFIVKWNFLKIVRLNIIFMVQLKTIPAVNQYSKQNDILSAPSALETSDCQSLPCLQMEPLFGERGRNVRMRSQSEASGFCQNVVEAVCVWDSHQSSPTYWQVTEAPEPQFPPLSKVGVIMLDPHDC